MSEPLVGMVGEWEAAHEALVEVRRERSGLDFREGQCLLAARRAGVHGQMGYEAVLRQCLERLSARSLTRGGGIKDVMNR